VLSAVARSRLAAGHSIGGVALTASSRLEGSAAHEALATPRRGGVSLGSVSCAVRGIVLLIELPACRSGPCEHGRRPAQRAGPTRRAPRPVLLLHAITERQRWRAEYAAAQLAVGEPPDNCSATSDQAA
jgi:hypothetical protein